MFSWICVPGYSRKSFVEAGIPDPSPPYFCAGLFVKKKEAVACRTGEVAGAALDARRGEVLPELGIVIVSGDSAFYFGGVL